MRRAWVLLSVLGSGLLAMTVMGGQPPGPPLNFPPLGAPAKVAENLYNIPGQGGNSAVWVRGNGVLLVDTKVSNNGKGLIDQIRTITDKPITHIVNTHTHGDHTGSNDQFPATIEIVVQENTRANMEKMDVFKSDAGKVGLPDRTYKDKLTLFSGKEAVDLYYFGPAHTNGDTLVVFREARVMHAGDMFAAKGMPLVDANNGGSGLGYPETIAKAAAGIPNVDRVIPGHDNVMAWQDFVDYGEFNRLLLEHARASLAAGKTPAQARADLKLPAKFAGYNLTPLFGPPEANFIGLYAELRK
jgi:cyclase